MFNSMYCPPEFQYRSLYMQNLAKENEYIISATNFNKTQNFSEPDVNIEHETVLALLTSSFDLEQVTIKSAQEFVKKTQREKKFCQKIQKMVRDVEKGEEDNNSEKGSKSIQNFSKDQKSLPIPSLADCWRWLKGLLYDFISLKRQCKKL